MSSFLNISSNENGDKPNLGQFQQASLSPYLSEIETQASLFAGECGLTLDDLGFSKANPSSVDAIKASPEDYLDYKPVAPTTLEDLQEALMALQQIVLGDAE